MTLNLYNNIWNCNKFHIMKSENVCSNCIVISISIFNFSMEFPEEKVKSSSSSKICYRDELITHILSAVRNDELGVSFL